MEKITKGAVKNGETERDDGGRRGESRVFGVFPPLLFFFFFAIIVEG